MIDEKFLQAQMQELWQNKLRLEGALNFCQFLLDKLAKDKAKEEKKDDVIRSDCETK